MEKVKGHFSPELLNRVDDVVLFNRLQRQDMQRIVEVNVNKALAVAESERGLKIEISPNAKEWLAEESYSPQYGARPLLRLIQRELLNPLSKLILKGDVVD